MYRFLFFEVDAVCLNEWIKKGHLNFWFEMASSNFRKANRCLNHHPVLVVHHQK